MKSNYIFLSFIKAHGLGSAILVDNFIFVYGPGDPLNNGFSHGVQRLDFTTEGEFISTQSIGHHSGKYKYPILYLAVANYCV